MRFANERWQFDCVPMSAWPGVAADGTDPARSRRRVLALIADDGAAPSGEHGVPALWVRETDLDFHDLLDRLRSAEPDVVVLRVGSPTDVDHLRAIRHLLPRAAVVALVDDVDDERLLHVLSLGADEVLPTELSDPLSICRTGCFAMVRRARTVELHEAAFTDSLTGVLDERGLWTLGPRTLEVVRAAGLPVVGVYADVDALATLNAEFGEETGDTALCRVTWLLRESFAHTELLARAGDDEFFLLTTDPLEASSNGTRLTCSLDRLHADVEVSVTLGMVSSPPGTPPDLTSLVRRARAEMTRVKGRSDLGRHDDSPVNHRPPRR